MRGGSERVRAFPAASAMADGTPSITERARKKVLTFNIRECIYACGGSECMRAFVPATSVIADSTLSIIKSAKKICVFTFNIHGCIYACGGAEHVRAFRLLR